CTLIALEDGLDLLEDPDVAILSQGEDSAAADAELFVGYYRFLRNLLDLTETVTYRAGAVRGVERERIRRRLVIRKPGLRVHEVLGVMMNLAVLFHRH